MAHTPALPDEATLNKILAAHDELGLTGPFWWSADSRGATVLFSQDAGRQAVLHTPKVFFRNIAPEGFNESLTGGEIAAKSSGFPDVFGALNNPAAIALASAWLVPILLRERTAAATPPAPVATGGASEARGEAPKVWLCYNEEDELLGVYADEASAIANIEFDRSFHAYPAPADTYIITNWEVRSNKPATDAAKEAAPLGGWVAVETALPDSRRPVIVWANPGWYMMAIARVGQDGSDAGHLWEEQGTGKKLWGEITHWREVTITAPAHAAK